MIGSKDMVVQRGGLVDFVHWWSFFFLLHTTKVDHDLKGMYRYHMVFLAPIFKCLFFSFFLLLFTKRWSYSVEGLLSTGPTPSSFLFNSSFLQVYYGHYKTNCFTWRMSSLGTKIISYIEDSGLLLCVHILSKISFLGDCGYLGMGFKTSLDLQLCL